VEGAPIGRSSYALAGLLDAVGTTNLGFEGVGALEGVVRGDAAALTAAILDGVGRLPSLAVAAWQGLALGAVRFGDAAIVLGVMAFVFWVSPGLDCSVEGPS
jgi:hypothetical protein